MPAKRPAKKSFTPDARGPLNGVRVVDLSRLVAGNVLTLQLADFGAEVIKIEPPEGDTLRSWKVKNVETAWKVYSRNKKSVALDLRSDAGRAIVRELCRTAAIVVESFRPGVMEDMGMSPAELHAINPKLVILRISGWGQDGRYRHKPGFGTLIEGYSGFASMNGFADREPVLPPMYLADCMAALNGYGAVLVALREVEINGGTGPGARPAAVRSAVLDAGAAGGQPQADRRGEGAQRQPLDQCRAAQRLPDEGRTLGLPVGLDAGHGRAGAGEDRPAGAGEGSALRHQHRAGEERHRARPHHRRVRGRPRSRREPGLFRRGRRHHRAGLRHRPDRRGRLCAGARGADRDPRRRHGRRRDADALGRAAHVGNAGRAEIRRAPDRRAQRGAAEAAARRRRIRQARPVWRDLGA